MTGLLLEAMVPHAARTARGSGEPPPSEPPDLPEVLTHEPPRAGRGWPALHLVRIFVVLLLVVPSNTTIPVIGAAGFPAGIVGMLAGLSYVAWTLFGDHNPSRYRYPTRLAFVMLWITTLCSYVACQFRPLTSIEANGADRWLLFLFAISGIALVAAEGLRNYEDLLKVLRTLVWAGAFCALVAVLQYWLSVDLSPRIGQLLPGFQYNGDLGGIQSRGALNRVPGTTLHPIELGGVTAILLPIAASLAVLDRDRSRWQRWTPVVLIALCVPVSVSRSAVLALAVAMLVFVAQVGPRLRLAVLTVVPVALAAVFMATPGFLRTIGDFFLSASTDTSVSTRTDDYALVERLVATRPWFGLGGGTYLPDDLLTVLDNIYLKWVVEFGLVGLVVLVVFYMALPVIAAVTIRKRTVDERLGLIATALSAGLAAAMLSAVTFDSLAFPTLACLQALVIGLVGTVWRLALGPESSLARIRSTEEPVDTLNIFKALRRNGKLVLPALAAVLILGVAVVVLVPTKYASSSTMLMLPPPAAPTDAQLEADPRLQGLDSDNPYTRQYDPTTMIAVISIPVLSDSGRQRVEEAGGSGEYDVAQVVRYGFATPFLTVTAQGSTPEEAVLTNQIVTEELSFALEELQSRDGPSSRYLISVREVKEPTEEAVVKGGQSRLILGLIGLAVFLVFAAVALGDAVREYRREKEERARLARVLEGVLK